MRSLLAKRVASLLEDLRPTLKGRMLDIVRGQGSTATMLHSIAMLGREVLVFTASAEHARRLHAQAKEIAPDHPWSFHPINSKRLPFTGKHPTPSFVDLYTLDHLIFSNERAYSLVVELNDELQKRSDRLSLVTHEAECLRQRVSVLKKKLHAKQVRNQAKIRKKKRGY